MQTEQINLDRLLYPIMMQIRSIKEQLMVHDQFRTQEIQLFINRILLDSQNKCEGMVLSLMRFAMDYILEGPKRVKLIFGLENSRVRNDVIDRLKVLQTYFGNVETTQLKQAISDMQQYPEGFSDSDSDRTDCEEGYQIKLTGHLREFNPELLELKQQVANKQLEIDQLKQKITNRQNSLEILSATHMKDVQNMKQQLHKQELIGESFEIFEVSYFDQTMMLDPELVEMMNAKIRDIKTQYEKFVYLMIERNKRLYTESTPKSNQTHRVDVSGLAIRDLIKLALEKCPNPYQLWKHIQDIKSNKFILQVLLQQQGGFGIDYKEVNEILRDVKPAMAELIQARIQIQEQLVQVSAQYLCDMETLRKEQMTQTIQLDEQRKEFEERVQRLRQYYNREFDEIIPIVKVTQLETDNMNLQSMINNYKQEVKQLELRINQIISNYRVVLKYVDPKIKTIKNIEDIDLVKDKPEIIRDLIYKLKHMDNKNAVAVKQLVECCLFANTLATLSQRMKERQQDQSTQTTLLANEVTVSNEMRQRSSEKRTSGIFKSVKHEGTQVDRLDQSPEMSPTNEVLLNLYRKQGQSKLEQDDETQKNVFRRLFKESKVVNERFKQLKPVLEKLPDDQFKEIQLFLNSYIQQDFKQQMINPYTIYNNNKVEIPQQDSISLRQIRKSSNAPQLTNRSQQRNKSEKCGNESRNLRNWMIRGNLQ